MVEASPTITLTPDDLQSLADRLYSRGVSKLLDDMPSVQADMRHASRAIRVLLTEIDKVAAVANSVTTPLNSMAHSLANLRITVEA